MRAWITVQQWLLFIHFVLADRAATRSGTNISSSRPATCSESVSSTSSSNYGGLSATLTATSTVITSLTVNLSLISVASGPSTQAQSNIPINPTSFSLFPVPSDNPILPNYSIVNPSQPLSVSNTTSAGTDTFESYFIGGLV